MSAKTNKMIPETIFNKLIDEYSKERDAIEKRYNSLDDIPEDLLTASQINILGKQGDILGSISDKYDDLIQSLVVAKDSFNYINKNSYWIDYIMKRKDIFSKLYHNHFKVIVKILN